MNEFRQTLKDAHALAAEGLVRSLIGKALDMLDAMEPVEMMAKMKHVKVRISRLTMPEDFPLTREYSQGMNNAAKAALSILREVFPDAKE